MPNDSSEISIGFVLVGDKTAASSRHRVLDPTKYFDDNINSEFLHLSNYDEYTSEIVRKILFSVNILSFSTKHDVVYIQKIPLPRIILQCINLIGPEIVFDFDDALYTSPQWEENSPKRRSRLIQSIKQSSAVVTGNPNLSSFAEQYNDQVYTLPTPVPKSNKISRTDEPEPVTIGWIGGRSNLRYLELIKEPLQRILDEYNTELVIISGDDDPISFFSARNDVQYLVWSLEDEYKQLSKFDLMIRPMADTEWINGKGGYTSVIRCMSVGIPVIASSIEPLREITTPDESILFASTSEEWYSKMKQLIEDPELRDRIGTKARSEINQQGLWTEDYAAQLQEILVSVGS